MKKFIWFLMMAATVSFTACDDDADDVDATIIDADTTVVEETTMAEDMLEQEGLRVYPMEGYKQFENVQLALTNPKDGAKINPGNVKFNYNVQNFELGKITEDAEQMGIANSADGQHLHVILNNEPYMAHYKPEFQKELTAGRYNLLTFPSRSYHLSIKDRGAMVLKNFTVGDAATATGDTLDLTKPHLFYSRPKGEYKGKDAQKVMLDFYLANTDLSDGHYVVADINGKQMKITKWQPYIMEGLPMGQNTITLTLYDAQGNIVQSPYNPVTRTITLMEGGETSEVMKH